VELLFLKLVLVRLWVLRVLRQELVRELRRALEQLLEQVF